MTALRSCLSLVALAAFCFAFATLIRKDSNSNMASLRRRALVMATMHAPSSPFPQGGAPIAQNAPPTQVITTRLDPAVVDHLASTSSALDRLENAVGHLSDKRGDIDSLHDQLDDVVAALAAALQARDTPPEPPVVPTASNPAAGVFNVEEPMEAPSNAGRLGAAALAATFDDEALRFQKVNLNKVNNVWDKDLINTSFFFMNQENGLNDDMLKYLLEHETHVISAFWHVLNTAPCKPTGPIQDFGCWTNHPLAQAALARGDTIRTMDIGSNSGFYTQMMGSMGYNVIAVDPQPQCALFTSAAAALNGLDVEVLNGFVGRPGDNSVVSVPSRTGCFGTFPIITEPERRVAKNLQASLVIPEDKKDVQVPTIHLADFLPANVFIPFVKVDTEGHEAEVFDSLDAQLRSRSILTIMMEANKIVWDKTDRSLDVIETVLARLVSYGYTFIPSSDGGYRTAAPREWAQPGVIKSWLSEGWVVCDILFFLPADVQ